MFFKNPNYKNLKYVVWNLSDSQRSRCSHRLSDFSFVVSASPVKRWTLNILTCAYWSEVWPRLFFSFMYPSWSCGRRYNIFASSLLLFSKIDDFPSCRDFGPAHLPTAWTPVTLECSCDGSVHQNSFNPWLLFSSLLLLTCLSFLLLSLLPTKNNTTNGRFSFFQVHVPIPSGSLFPPELESFSRRQSGRGKSH